MITRKVQIAVLLLAVIAIGAPYKEVAAQQEQLPKLDEVAAFLDAHIVVLDRIYDLYRDDERISWVECGENGQFKVTSWSQEAEIDIGSTEREEVRQFCLETSTWLVQRVKSGVSVHWRDIATAERRFRIELYRTDQRNSNTCEGEDFSSSVASCMLSLNENWEVRYFWLPHNAT